MLEFRAVLEPDFIMILEKFVRTDTKALRGKVIIIKQVAESHRGN
jgi:hypothetical protein